MEVKTVYTTEECAECRYIFNRYATTQSNPEVAFRKSVTAGKAQVVCPNCEKPVFIQIVSHPEVKL